MGRLDGKVAIITGGNSGVGAATAELFAKEGAKVVITARRVPQLEEVAEKIRSAGGEVLAVPCDVSTGEAVEEMVAKVVETYGQIDVLVNNAGVLEAGLKPIDCCTDEDLEWVLGINTKGCLYCTRAVVKEMMKNNKGSINRISKDMSNSKKWKLVIILIFYHWIQTIIYLRFYHRLRRF